MTKKHIVADNDQAKFLRMNADLTRKFLSGVYPPETFFQMFDEFVKNPFVGLKTDQQQIKMIKNPCLRLISGGQEIIIPETSGYKTIAKAHDIFTGGIGDNFAKWNVGGRSAKNPAMPIQVFKLIRNTTLKEMFSSLSDDLGKLALTGHQVREFCAKHKDWLRQDSNANFFLLKKKDRFFVANVNVRDGGRLLVFVRALENVYVWHADYRYRVVVPQL